jgi:hypothetical protein
MNNNAESNLYNLLVTQDLEPEILDSSGRPVTDPTQAELFSFNWKTENHDYGTVVVLVGQDNQLEVYFGDNLGRTMEADDKSQWYDFLHQLKSFASRNMLTFEINNINRLKYTMQGMAAIKEGLFEGYYGRKNVSYSDEPKQVRLMIKHNRNIGEGEARHRAIESLFVETADGERFKLPFRNLIGGRVMARHCAEGGNPYDAFGQHICEMVTEMNTLARFVRASRGKTFATETTGLVESAVRHYQDLKDKAKRMIGQRGYHEEREIYDPAAATGSELTVESIREMFIERNIDQRIEEALPILARLAMEYKEENMKEVNEFESWTNQVMEGTWALPDSSEADTKLKELMSKPLIVGADATNATEQLYDLVGDDELFDRLNDLAEEDPNANCWDDPAVMDRLNELGVDTSMGPGEADAAGDAEALADPEMGPQTQPELDDQIGENDLNLMRRRAGIQQGMTEGNGDTEIRPGMRVSQGTVVKVNGNTVTVKTSNGDMMNMNIHDVDQGMAEGEGNLATALGKLSGGWSGWHKEEDMSSPDIDVYEYDDGEGGYYGRGTIEHNLKSGEVKVEYHDSENDVDVDGTFKNMGDAMRALRGQWGQNHGGKAPNFDRLGQRKQHGPDDLRKTDRTGRKGTLAGGPSNELKRSINFNKGKHGPQGVLPEGEDHSPVASAITRRILMQRADLLSKYGPEKVTAAIDDVADFVGDTEEIGSSDVSGWVRQVEQSLGGVDEGILDTAKKIGNQVFDKLGGGSDEELLNKLRKDAGLPPRMAVPNKKEVDEELDTDGVMMTRPSNMSS